MHHNNPYLFAEKSRDATQVPVRQRGPEVYWNVHLNATPLFLSK